MMKEKSNYMKIILLHMILSKDNLVIATSSVVFLQLLKIRVGFKNFLVRRVMIKEFTLALLELMEKELMYLLMILLLLIMMPLQHLQEHMEMKLGFLSLKKPGPSCSAVSIILRVDYHTQHSEILLELQHIIMIWDKMKKRTKKHSKKYQKQTVQI